MTDELKKQYTRRITTANKTELIVILYEMILTYIEEAKEKKEEENRAGYSDAIRKIRGCIQELVGSLHLEYNLAKNLLQLYLYISRELVKADVKFTLEPLNHIEKVISGLQEAYVVLAAKDTSGPVMENAQAVYAGMTYGKTDLTENMTDQGANRGFLV